MAAGEAAVAAGEAAVSTVEAAHLAGIDGFDLGELALCVKAQPYQISHGQTGGLIRVQGQGDGGFLAVSLAAVSAAHIGSGSCRVCLPLSQFRGLLTGFTAGHFRGLLAVFAAGHFRGLLTVFAVGHFRRLLTVFTAGHFRRLLTVFAVGHLRELLTVFTTGHSWELLSIAHRQLAPAPAEDPEGYVLPLHGGDLRQNLGVLEGQLGLGLQGFHLFRGGSGPAVVFSGRFVFAAAGKAAQNQNRRQTRSENRFLFHGIIAPFGYVLS